MRSRRKGYKIFSLKVEGVKVESYPPKYPFPASILNSTTFEDGLYLRNYTSRWLMESFQWLSEGASGVIWEDEHGRLCNGDPLSDLAAEVLEDWRNQLCNEGLVTQSS